jgi:energy-converting hydrogenase Eha subunit E
VLNQKLVELAERLEIALIELVFFSFKVKLALITFIFGLAR